MKSGVYRISHRYNRDVSKLFQIYEDDLAELERTLPQFVDVMLPLMKGELRRRLAVQVRRGGM